MQSLILDKSTQILDKCVQDPGHTKTPWTPVCPGRYGRLPQNTLDTCFSREVWVSATKHLGHLSLLELGV